MSNRNWGLAACLMCLLLAGCPGGTDPAGSGGVHESGAEDGPAAAAVNPNAYSPAGAVLPSEESIKKGEYKPLSRPLYVYVNKGSLKHPEIVAFLRYYLSPEGQQQLKSIKAITLDAEEYAKQMAALEDAVKAAGTVVEGTLAGQMTADGSSTVGPLTSAVVEGFSEAHPNVRIDVSESGTGGGFGRFIKGEIDLCNASRPIKESEIETCKQNKVDYLELKVALDGITVAVNPGNSWVNGLTVADLKKIWEPDSKVQKWSDLNPEFPNQVINLYGPDAASGTFEYFTEEVNGKKAATRADYQKNANDNILVKGVAQDEYALGYFGFTYYLDSASKLKALGIAP